MSPPPNPRRTWLRRSLPFAYQGALLAAAIIALPLGGVVHEAEASLTTHPPPGAEPVIDLIDSYLSQLTAADASLEREGTGRWRVRCHDALAQAATQRCHAIVSQARTHFPGWAISGQVQNAARTFESRLLALAVGLGIGIAWIFVRLELRAHRDRHATAALAEPPSSPLPAVVQLRPSGPRPPLRAASTPPARPRTTPALARTFIGTGPSTPPAKSLPHSPPVLRVIDTQAELVRPRPTGEDPLAPYESTSHWSPHPALFQPKTHSELDALCKQLSELAASGCRAFRISSDYPSTSFKSHLAAQLAWSLAERGDARVLLVEADFDDPNVHRVLSLQTPPFQGFSQQLYRRLTTGERTPWCVARCGQLGVLAEGRVRTPGLSARTHFGSALAELRRHYDIIVIDGPPAETLAAARARGGVADGLVFAAAAGSEAITASEPPFDASPLWIVHTPPAGAERHG